MLSHSPELGSSLQITNFSLQIANFSIRSMQRGDKFEATIDLDAMGWQIDARGDGSEATIFDFLSLK